MNIKALEKIEKGWIRLEWEYLKRLSDISIEILEDIVDTIERFHKNRSAKEIAVLKIKGLPAYVTVSKNEYLDLLNWLLSKFVEQELYEVCQRIGRIKSALK